MKTRTLITLLVVTGFIVGVAGAYYISTQMPIEPQTFTCPIDGAAFTTTEAYLEHMRVVHGINHMTP